MKILSSKTDRRQWLSIWEAWEGREVYAHPDYIDLYTDPSSEALCAVSDFDGARVIYPFIRRSLMAEPWCGEQLYDLTTAYGYGGIYIIGSPDRADTESFCRDFAEWAKDNGVVCEFIRFALNSPSIGLYTGETVCNNQNVVVDLALSEDSMWSNFKHKVRKNVNRARSLNLEIEVDTQGHSLDDFIKIYYDTMDRNGAAAGYYFPEEYFRSIVENLGGQFAFFNAKDSDRVISTELVLVSDHNIYSFLGGTLEEFFAMRPGDLLKFEVINWGRASGKKRFVLGGGHTPMDGIFQYKQAFAPDGIEPFYIGKQIFNEEQYNRLIARKRELNPAWTPSESFFPQYRS